MNKFALLAAMSLAVVGVAAAQTKTPVKKTIACAVMTKDTVNIADATKNKMFADYNGRRYFFCCAGCPGAFKKDPAKFAKNESIPAPKPSKKA